MAPKFGTSGLRGLVTELTPSLVQAHCRAFLAACDPGTALYVGRDLRASSPAIAGEVIKAARGFGLAVVDCGALPTPALALAALEARAAAVMVTGSHIPADRNGLKFYTPAGEITKSEELAILAALPAAAADLARLGLEPSPQETAALGAGKAQADLRRDPEAGARFIARYVTAFGPRALSGRRIGVYSHSAVGSDALIAILAGLGAEVRDYGRSEVFLPVDTEAVDPEIARWLADLVRSEGLDAMVSTDGDSDRPLMVDDQGRIVPGDILGQITAEALGAARVVTPISSNSGVTAKGFERVIRTKIGSPFVIAGMAEAGGRVVGYEANGGFLLGFDAAGPSGPLAALPTRDCMLPLVMALLAAEGGPLSERVATEPPVVTLADRLQEVEPARSAQLLAQLGADAAARADFLAGLDLPGAPLTEAGIDRTDGLRILLAGGGVLHLRPSGNAPEFRLYVEAETAACAQARLTAGLAALRRALV